MEGKKGLPAASGRDLRGRHCRARHKSRRFNHKTRSNWQQSITSHANSCQGTPLRKDRESKRRRKGRAKRKSWGKVGVRPLSACEPAIKHCRESRRSGRSRSQRSLPLAPHCHSVVLPFTAKQTKPWWKASEEERKVDEKQSRYLWSRAAFSILIVSSNSTLCNFYDKLHPLYIFYVCDHARNKKKHESTWHPVIQWHTVN